MHRVIDIDIESCYNLAAASICSDHVDSTWCIDSGASIHICNDISLFTDIDYDGVQLRVAGVSKNRMYTSGCGTVKIPVLDLRTNSISNFVLEDVYYLPNQPHNLISLRQALQKYKSAHSPDFKNMHWRIGKYLFQLRWHGNMYCFMPIDPEVLHYEKDRELVQKVSSVNIDKYACDSLRLSDTEFDRLSLLYAKSSKFDINLFGHADITNDHFATEWTTDEYRYNHNWYAKSFFGIVPPNLSILQKTLEKAHLDFKEQPDRTVQLLVVPYLPDSSAWFYTKYYETLHIYDKDVTDTFMCHKDDYFLFSNLVPDTVRPKQVDDDKLKDYVYLPGLPVQFAVLYRDCNTPMQTDDYVKAHLRFGHRSAPYIRNLLEKGVNIGDDIRLSADKLKNRTHLCDCEACILSRMQRPRHKKLDPTRHSHLKPFEYIVTDIHGPISPQAADGSNYVIHFTCVKTRYTWGACIEKRTDALYYFAQFLDFVGQSGYSVKQFYLKTDNAGEYTNPEFTQFCIDRDITKLTTSAYAHEENGIAEVIWREIAAVARAMMVTADLPKNLWHLAYDHSFWLRCRMPHIENDMKIPYLEVFPNRKLDLSNVRVFGCKAYQWLDPDQRYRLQDDVSRHLHDRSRSLVYIGHDDHSAAWLLYDIDRQTIIKSGRPRFIEQFNNLGRRISKPITDNVLDANSLNQHKILPDGFVEDLSLDVQNFTISDHSIHYDEVENEISCIVKVHSLTDNSGTWTYLHNCIQCHEQYNIAYEYLDHFYKQGNLNSFYPLFSVCSSRPEGYRRYFSCIMSSIDLGLYSYNQSGGDALCYGVIFDPKHGFDSGITSCSRDMMKFTDITTACKIMRATVTEDNLKKYLGYVPPNSYLEAMTYPDAQHWHKATIDEVQQCLDMGVFEFLGPDFNPKGKNIIDTRMVYVLKIIKATGLIDKYKGRLVVRGFRQIPGTDYDETYSPATHLPVIRSFFVMCLFLGLRIHALDVKGAFLQSPITDYELYIKLPEGFTAFGGHKYAKLKKSIYGLKQAARDWHEHQEKFLLSQDFKKSTIDPCYYVYIRKDVTSIIYVHIDDYLVGCNNDKFYKDFLVAFSNYTCYKEDICDLGDPLNHMQIAIDYSYEKGTVSFSSERYILETISRFGMDNCTTKSQPLPRNLNLKFGGAPTCESTYRSIIGCLLWISRTLRVDIQFATTYMSQYVSCCTDDHLSAVKHIIRFLAGTKDRILKYSTEEMLEFVGPTDFDEKRFHITVKCDSDFASDTSDHKSFTGFLIYLNGHLVDWVTRKQSLTATSTSEAEYIALSEACKTALHLYQLISEFFIVVHPITVLCDSTSAQAMAENNLNSKRTKHIWIIYRFVTDWIRQGLFKVFHIGTKDNLADFMTKIPKDVNFITNSSLLFQSITAWSTEVVCYNTDQNAVTGLLDTVRGSEIVCRFMHYLG
jgi:hypothetical protein